MVEKVEPWIPRETHVFLVGYPASMASLAKLDPKNKERALRAELYAGGLELANGFEELTDSNIQRERFIKEEQLRRDAKKTPFTLDEKFLDALKTGMPSCAGMAMGVDRLVMLLTGAQSINEVVTLSQEEL